MSFEFLRPVYESLLYIMIQFVCLFSITLSFGLEMGVRAVYSLLLSCGFQELRCLPAKLSHWPLTGPCCWPGTLSISGCPQTKPFWLCLLAQPPKIWDYRHALPTPACCSDLFVSLSSSSSCVCLTGGVGQGTTSGVLVPPCWRQGFFVSLPVQVAALWVVGILQSLLSIMR